MGLVVGREGEGRGEEFNLPRMVVWQLILVGGNESFSLVFVMHIMYIIFKQLKQLCGISLHQANM